MSNDRSERLRKKRKGAKEKAQGESESEPSETSETDETSKPSESSVKDEQVGRYMYLPEMQNRRVDQVYNKLKADYEFEYEEELEKNRHYFPLLIQYGLDSLDGFEASDVRDVLESLEVRD